MSAKRNLDTLNVRLLNFTDDTIYHRGRPIYLLYPDSSGCIAGPIGINICPGDIIIDGSGTTHDHSSYTQAMTGDLNVNSRIQLAVDPANLSGGPGMPPGHDGVVGGGDAQPGQIIFTRDVSGNYTFFGYEQTDGGTWGWHAFSTSTSKLSNIWSSEGNGTIYFNGSPDPTNVGIGNNNPLNTLDVNGSVAIGNTYAGTITAPTDGVIIKGNVGIGTHNPTVKLDVEGSGHFTDNLTVTGNTILNTLSAGDSTLTNVGITNNASIGGTLAVTGHTTLNTLSAGDSTLTNVGITNNASIGGTLAVTGHTTLNTLSAGDSTLTNVGITNNASIGGTLNVIGATELGGTLDVTRDTTLSTLWVNETLNVIGATELGGTLDVTGNTTLELVTIKGSLDITGTVNLNNTTQSTSSTIGALTIDGGVGIAKNTNIGGILGVMGATELGGTMNVSGATTISDNLTVTGNTILNTVSASDATLTKADITNNASIGGTLDVSGATTISDNLNVTGTSTLASATVGGTLDVSGATTISDNLDVTGTSTLASATVGGTLDVSEAITLRDGIIDMSGTNLAMGYKALAANIDGSGNTAIGYQALLTNIDGSGNTAVGYKALPVLQTPPCPETLTATKNTAIGMNTLGNLCGGIGNTAIGYGAGHFNGGMSAPVSFNTFIGYNAGSEDADPEGYFVLGDQNVSELQCQQQTITALSDQRDKKDIIDIPYGLDLINNLQPRQFTWDMRGETNDNPNQGKTRVGFIAQEVQAVLGENNNVLNMVNGKNPEKLMLSYGQLVPVLTKAVQELTAKLTAMEARLTVAGL